MIGFWAHQYPGPDEVILKGSGGHATLSPYCRLVGRLRRKDHACLIHTHPQRFRRPSR